MLAKRPANGKTQRKGTKPGSPAFEGVVVIDRSEESEQSERPPEGAAALAPAATSFEAFFDQHHAVLVRALAMALGDVELGRDAASRGLRPGAATLEPGVALRQHCRVGLPRGAELGPIATPQDRP